METARFFPDAMIYDEIVSVPGMVDALRRLKESGTLILYSTHVLEEQISKGPNADRRLSVPREEVGAGVFLVGSGRIGIDRLGSAEPYETVRGEGQTHIADAVIAATAHMDGAFLITHDKRLIARATGQSIPTINFPAFEALVRRASASIT
jgi:hypothetical protein